MTSQKCYYIKKKTKMAKAVKNKEQEFELIKFEANQIVNFSKWENQQKKLVKDNPFIKVVDKETHEIAKKRRTNLVTGRTDLQKERDAVKKELNRAKTFVADKYDGFIAISVPAETKQQENLTVYENELKAENDRQAALEEKRIADINQLIEDCETSLEGIIERMTFETIEDSEKSFDATVDSGQYEREVFEEREFLFEEMTHKMSDKLNEKAAKLRIDEQTRLDQLSVKQQAFINELYIEAIRVIEQNPHEAMFIQKVQNVFDVDFDFGEHTEQFESTRKELVKKAMAVREKSEQDFKQKELQDHQTKLLEQRNRIIQIREGILDLVFQMNQENIDEQKELIKKQSETPNGLLDELIPEWEKAKERIGLTFDAKVNQLEMEQDKLNKIGAERFKSRKIIAENNGFEFIEDEQRFIHPDTNQIWFTAKTVVESNDETWETFFKGIVKSVIEIRDGVRELESRRIELEKTGFEIDEDKSILIHQTYPGIRIQMSNVTSITDEGWIDVINHFDSEIKSAKDNDAKEQERQNKMKIDKAELMEWINHSVRQDQKPFDFQNPETDALFQSMIDNLNQWCDDKIQEIKNF